MNFIETGLPGAWLIQPETVEDERGFFARTYSHAEFAERGLETHWTQCSLSYNAKAATLRGMHYQAHPYEEAKLVRCSRGALYDVLLDLRRGSPTYRRWYAVELTAQNHRLLYVPRGLAHGFMTLADETEVSYQISATYHPASARGVRWNDPAFGIQWPGPVSTLSLRDRDYPDFNDEEASLTPPNT
jgi:dTDP-4-dehydrorhamnose 3,5-epimerase